MKHSLPIRRKFTLIFAALLMGTIAVMVIMTSLLLPRVYRASKQAKLVETYNMIDQSSASGDLSSDDFSQQFEYASATSGISMIVMESDGTIVASTGAEGDTLVNQFRDVLFGMREDAVVIEKTDNYVIEQVSDQRISGDYMVLFGTLSDGTMAMMRVAVASMQESAQISTQFILLVGVVLVVVGSIVIFFVTKKITDPIKNLSELSQRMADLDFDAKYEAHGDNEIDQLGTHMNELSTALEHTISDLKTANNEMKIDLDRKEQIDQMRTEFLSNVSHELKTPIALIQGYAEGLKDCINDDPESRDFYCDVIVDESAKMNRMVRKLLELNQIEFGKDEFSIERFDIYQLLNGVLNSMKIMLEQEDIHLDYQPGSPIYVWADEFKIEEVVTNYMSNAIHHIGGQRHIRVNVDQKPNVVRISVFNNGTPIPEEELSKLWEKFYKVDKSHSRQYGGNGIGLSIVQAIMDAHHQQFGVENHPDGVEFWFELDANLSENDENIQAI